MENLSIGEDILLSKHFNKDVLEAQIAKIFNITKDFVIVQPLDNIEKSINKNIKIYCYINDIKGDFIQLLAIFIKDKNLAFNKVLITKKLAISLNINCLISDDSYNPFTMILIDSKGIVKKVYLDDELLDSEIYKIHELK